MKNHQVAQVFHEIADLLSLKGERIYRVLAYRKAADAISEMGEDINEVWRAGRLKEIKGVGEAIASKIDELLTTGQMKYYQELTAEYPASLVEVLNVSNVGPKKAALFYQELGIASIEELEQAAAAGQLRELPGMGEKSEERILQGIESLRRQQTDRLPLGKAWTVADSLLASLKELPGVEQVETAGSLRRGRETIGDLDLLAAGRDPRIVLEAFTKLPQVVQVEGQGDTKASVVFGSGVRVQLWVHAPDHFGSALQYATGSADHNVKLRELARKQGLSLSEHGFKPDGGGSEIACRTEEEVYDQLGLPWIAPELREDRGEIEAALEGGLPNLIGTDDLKADLHCHSVWSDGVASIQEMSEAAMRLGYTYLVISDHSRSLGVANGLSIERLRDQRGEIDQVQEHIGGDLLLLQGSEVEILADGSLDYPDEVLASLDFVIASLHSSLGQERERITDRLLGVIENPNVDMIGHPTGRLIGRREPADLDMEAVFKAAQEHGTILEINANPDRLDLKDVYARRAVELGCLLAINTDAHRTDEFQLQRFGVQVARRGWVEPAQVINTLSVQEFQSWLAKRN